MAFRPMGCCVSVAAHDRWTSPLGFPAGIGGPCRARHNHELVLAIGGYPGRDCWEVDWRPKPLDCCFYRALSLHVRHTSEARAVSPNG